ncbi:NAD-dependent epimerase/dehydratase family protein [Pararhizobium sp. DWP3-4]|uniref:NAD-dependent epimerase/dehydratase family protein n=1 Tax=Pararhizobium sp. DWP3-4 TaxID=2804565 RepID=UPI003CFBB69A
MLSRLPDKTPVIVITGAAGRIGSLLRERLSGDPELKALFGGSFTLRLTDIIDLGAAGPNEDVRIGNLADEQFVDGLFADQQVQAVIHLAGYPREADWEVLLDANIRPSINIWEAARRTGVDRVLFASSNHATGFYARSQTIGSSVPPRPDSRYGLTKVFSEQLGFLYAYKFGVRSFSMRIGMFLPEPTTRRGLSTWLSYDDTVALVKVGLFAEYTSEVVYGVSNNERAFWDNSAAFRLGYRPKDNAERFAHMFLGPDTTDEVAERFQGGVYTSNGLVRSGARLAELEKDPI